ncbi:MAG: aminopeptidase P family protein [Myxococcales bacterium]|nr:aminopeptidase P family protein [Myxococcales bacterium]
MKRERDSSAATRATVGAARGSKPTKSTSAKAPGKKKPAKAVAKPSAKAKAPKAKPAASHDTANPPALLEFMTRDWKAKNGGLPSPIAHADAFRARRKKLSKRFAGEYIVLATGHEKVRANDTHYRFRPNSEFFYFTGNHEPDCVLVLEPTKDGHRDVLYVEPNPGKTDATFFTDRNKGELWVGPRLGVEESRARFAVDEARSLGALAADLAKLPATKTRVLRGVSKRVDSVIAARSDEDTELATFCSELRLRKESIEVRELRDSIASTKRGFEDVITRLKVAQSEREVEGVFNLRARVEGNDVGYGTIAAAGCHACTLHWTRNDGGLKKGELLLLDAGVEGNSLYTADITRTLPISGRFTAAQREIYTLVDRARLEAMKEVSPGRDFLAPNRAAMRVLTEGLIAMGILKCSLDEALDDSKMFYKRYTLHNVSHMLGLDVHDCARARMENYKYGKLEAGMVLTVEPGLYFQIDDLTVPAKYRGIGVRIEDDVLVTDHGYDNLSRDIPTDCDAVEAWMASVWARG